jgi:hypothetical protein
MAPTVTWARVTAAQTDTIPGQRIAPFAAGVVLPIAAVTAVLHGIASVFGDGYWFDEVYMLAIGRYHLDWGSADQPPLAPTLAALADEVAPGSLIALRVPAVLATAGGVVVAGLIARELGCDRRAQGFTAAAQATGVWTTLFGHWLTPYALEPVQWLLVFWLLVRWVRLRDDRLLLALGAVTGIALLTKFQVLLLCVLLATCSASPTSSPRISTATPSATSCQGHTAPTAVKGTSRRHPPGMTRCCISDTIPARCARTSPMCERSVPSARTCTLIC